MIKKFEDFLITEERRIERVSIRDIVNDFETGLPRDAAMGILTNLGKEIENAIKKESLDDKDLAKVLVWIGRNFRYNLMEVNDTIVQPFLSGLETEKHKGYLETYTTLYAAFPLEDLYEKDTEDGMKEMLDIEFDEFLEKVTKRAKRYFPWNIEGGKIKILDDRDF